MTKTRLMQSTYQLPVIDTLKAAWQKVAGTKLVIWASYALIFLIMFALGFLSGLSEVLLPILEVPLTIIAQFVSFLLTTGVMYIGIQRAYDTPVSYRTMFHAFQKDIVLKLIGLLILEILIFLPFTIVLVLLASLQTQENLSTLTLLSLVVLYFVLICGMLYISVRMFFAIGIVVAQARGPWQAIKDSFRATRCNFWRIIGLWILQVLVVLVSMIPLGIGLIWSLPWITICYGVAYKNLLTNNMK
ncbi:MAG TPA: DUF975 family protein [Gammaproteobacteria bacterium]|jgi:uncharacterized membrane protein|nr:DUF975 family protein [Gammaproteobacteria bacterium]